MPRSGHRTLWALFLTAAILLVAAVAPTGMEPARDAIAQESDLTVHDQGVQIDYPDSIEFHLNIEAPVGIEEVELRYQPAFSEVTRAERPNIEPGTAVETSYALDLRTSYLPPGIEINYRWVVTLSDGQELETEPQQFFFIDNRYDWQETTEGPVSVYHYAGGPQFGQLAMEVVTRTVDGFDDDFGTQLEDPINVVVYGSSSEFQQALPYNSPEWIGAFAEPDQNLIVAGVEPGDRAASEMGRVMTHEVVHLLVDQATENPYNSPPRWLDEGLAINYQEVPEERYSQIMDQAIEQGKLIPVPALRSSFPSDPDLAVQSYAQSQSIVRYLIEERGHQTVGDLLATYQEGVAHDEAVQQALGMSLTELDAAWKAWLDYDGDQTAQNRNEPVTPGFLQRVEDVWARAGVMPVLVVGGLIVMVLGIIKMVRAINTRDLDEDVDPEVEYYGQAPLHEPDAEDGHDPR